MKNKLRIITSILLIFTSLIIISPLVAAKSRNSYLIDFVYSNQDSNELFGDTFEETAQALEILEYYDAFRIEGIFGVENRVDKVALSDHLEENLIDMLDSQDIVLYDVYYILHSLKLIGSNIDSSLSQRIQEYLNQSSQNTGGFTITNTSSVKNIISTYFAYLIYNNLGVQFPNRTIHMAWILSCGNQDGGYGGNSSLTSTLITTYFSVYLVNEMDSVDALVNKSKTLEYLNSFYIDDIYDSIGYGGYIPAKQSVSALLSSTYLATASINAIDSSELNEDPSVSWVLYRQSFQDGGFSDKFGDTNQETSSITSSFYAFKTLMLFDSLALLNQEIFMVEFDFLFLIILLSVIGVLLLLVYFIWRRRRV